MTNTQNTPPPGTPVATAGKPRKPLTPGVAAACVLFNGLIITAIIVYWGGPS